MISKIRIDQHGIYIDGKNTELLCASLFYFRIPRAFWKDRIRKLKKAGYNCVDVYFPWNFHEKAPNNWCFEGEAEVNAFLDILANEKMYVIARPGPYICSEWDGGSIPAWVLTSGSPIRDKNPEFLSQVKKWYEKIIPMIASHDINHGGSVIFMQIENELDFFDCKNITDYMTKLSKLAKSFGISIPLVSCAGQGSVLRAVENCKEVIPTYNFYPDVFDVTFDDKVLITSKTLAKHNFPLMITETSGDHFLLRREFANGAKLLGAYNQVGGYNFGFTNSINNWGDSDDPLSFITSEYGSLNIINSYGEYTKEAFEGKLFSRFLNTFSEYFATFKTEKLEDSDNFKITSLGKTAKDVRLITTSNGVLLCIPNFDNSVKTFDIQYKSSHLSAKISSHSAPFFAFNFKLDKVSEGFEIISSTVEIIKADKNTVYAYGNSDSFINVRFKNGYETKVKGLGTINVSDNANENIKIVILSRIEALLLDFQNEALKLSSNRENVSIKEVGVSKCENLFKPLKSSTELSMETNGLYSGYVSYDVTPKVGKSLLVSGTADIISAYAGEKYIDTKIGHGSFLKYQNNENDDFHFRVESWGHCNFDDARLPSLRMTSKKGFEHIYTINKEENDFVWRFVLCDKWLPEKLELKKSEFDAIITPNSWNTTRVPLIAAYYTSFAPTNDSDNYVAELKGNCSETAIYVGNKLAGTFNPKAPFIDITKFVTGDNCEITLLARKLDWSMPVGNLVIYHLKKMNAKISYLSTDDISALCENSPVITKLPISIAPGKTAVLSVNMDNVPHTFEHAKVHAKDLKLTAVFNGRIVGRVFGETDFKLTLHGGDPSSFYIPKCWYKESGNKLLLYVEGIGRTPMLSSLKFEEVFS